MIEPSYFWLNIFFLALGTFAIRFSIIAASSRVRISERTRQVFSFIPSAVLPAFVAPAVFFHAGTVELLYGKERLVILIFATAICYFTRSTLATIAAGLATLYLLTQYL